MLLGQDLGRALIHAVGGLPDRKVLIDLFFMKKGWQGISTNLSQPARLQSSEPIWSWSAGHRHEKARRAPGFGWVGRGVTA
jgi:hypothetical protein